MYCIALHRIIMRFARISFLVLFAAIAGAPQAPAQYALVTVMVAPPPLPYYDQPPMPSAGYIWTPGYWAWDQGDYYWVPGTWAAPPSAGLLWTPGFWLWRHGVYIWIPGYWGQHVGFYGGVNYGYGYAGTGYAGGVWRGSQFSYNSTVNNFGGLSVANAYEQTVVEDNDSNVSFNGGTGGTTATPNQEELAANEERHVGSTAEQVQHQAAASTNNELRASVNGGNPAVAATTYAAHFHGTGVTSGHAHRADLHRGPAGGSFQHHLPQIGSGVGSHNLMTAGPFQHHLPNGSLNVGPGSHASGGMPGQFPGGHLSSRMPDMPPSSHSGGGAGQFGGPAGGSSHVGHASTSSSRPSGSWGGRPSGSWGGRPSGLWGGGSSGPRFSGSVSRGPVSGGFHRR